MTAEIVIAGVGMIPFRKPGQSESYDVMGARAARAALDDAGIGYSLVEQAVCGYVYGDSCAGQAALYHIDINGVPIFNVTNNCASGSTAFSLAAQAVNREVLIAPLRSDRYDLAGLAGLVDRSGGDHVRELDR